MSVSQISMFLESKPGHLSRVLNKFEESGVNVRGYSAGDTGDYGIVRFVVDKPEEGLAVLKEMGAAAKLSQVLCLRLEDKPGELARIMNILASDNINIVYSYSLISTYICLTVTDLEEAERVLEKEPVELVTQEELSSIEKVHRA